MDSRRYIELLEDYWDIGFGFIFLLLTIYFSQIHNIYMAALFSALAIGSFSVTVSEIAEIIAERLGEPFGSLVLTFTAVIIEILILFMIVLESVHSPEAISTVKEGIISTVLVDLNALLGLALFVGGLSFKEQEHNEDTSSSYTTILLVATAMFLVPSTLGILHNEEALYKASLIISVFLFVYYIFIFRFQTKTHIHFFKSTARSRLLRYKKKMNIDNEEEDDNYFFAKRSNKVNFIMLFVLLAVIGYTAEIFAHTGIKIFNEFNISSGFAGLIIAFITVAPELFTAVKAAKNDQTQRVVNIAMGASTVSIMLTVPILMFLTILFNVDLTLDFTPLQVGALLLTIILVWKTTDNGETNYLEGLSHLMLFSSYAVIAFFYN